MLHCTIAISRDQRTEVRALIWLGRDTHYLIGAPLLADDLEQGRALLDDPAEDDDAGS